MGKSTRTQALLTRERILDTAERLFEKQGVSRTSLEDIAGAAGVTRGAIYGHFSNKSSLFVAMYNRVRPPIDDLYAKDASDLVDPLGKLRDMMAVSFKLVGTKSQDQRVLNIMLHKCELTEDLSELVSRSRQIWKGDARRRRFLLRQAIAQGQLPKDLDVARAEITFRGFMMGIISNWTLAPRSFNLVREADALVEGYIDMLRSSPALLRRRSKT